MPLAIRILTAALTIVLIVLSTHLIWRIRGGVFSRALLPIVVAWITLGIVALIEIFDVVVWTEELNHWMRFVRVILYLIGAYTLWHVVAQDAPVRIVRK